MTSIANEHQTFNLFPIAGTNFTVNFSRLPELTFVTQEVNIPQVSTQLVKQASPGLTIFQPGDKLSYEALNVKFLVDEELRAYRELYGWLVGTTGGHDRSKFVAEFIGEQSEYIWGETNSQKTYGRSAASHAALIITNSAKLPILKVVYANVRITSLGQLDFSTTLTDPNAVMTCTASFTYDYFEILEIRK